MNVAIIATKDITEYNDINSVMSEHFPDKREVKTVLMGSHSTSDITIIQWTMQNGIPVICIKPDYQTYQENAYPVRNEQIIKRSDVVIALIKSKDDANIQDTVKNCKRYNKRLIYIDLDS